jgi:hypothetical protein
MIEVPERRKVIIDGLIASQSSQSVASVGSQGARMGYENHIKESGDWRGD